MHPDGLPVRLSQPQSAIMQMKGPGKGENNFFASDGRPAADAWTSTRLTSRSPLDGPIHPLISFVCDLVPSPLRPKRPSEKPPWTARFIILDQTAEDQTSIKLSRVTRNENCVEHPPEYSRHADCSRSEQLCVSTAKCSTNPAFLSVNIKNSMPDLASKTSLFSNVVFDT